jgi:hypothetical protein
MMRSFTAVLVLILASGCGGAGTATTDTSGTGSAVTDPLTSSADGSATSIATTDPTSGADESDSTTVVDITEARFWAIELADPTGPRLRDWATSTTQRPAVADAPDGIDGALAWIYADLIELWRNDDRVRALAMSEVALARAHRDAVPGAAIDILGSAAAMLADSYAIIADRASAATRPGSPGEPLFAAWSEYATRSGSAAERLRSALVDARSLSLEDQACFLAVFAGDDGCGGVGADLATAVLADAETNAQAIDEVEIDDLGTSRTFGVEFDECAAWDLAASTTGLTDSEESKIWLAIDGHDLDVKFAARSACHGEREGIDDAAVDEVADRALFRDYLEAVAAAVVETGYDEMSVELGNGAEDERHEYEYRSGDATTLVVDVARDLASRTWVRVDDPVLATTLYEVADLEFDDWAKLGLYELAWDEVTECDMWTEVLGELQTELDDDALSAFDVAVSELGIVGSLVPDHCD